MYLKRAPYTIDLAMSSLNVAATEEWSGECGKPERVEFKCTHRSEMCNNLKTDAFWEKRDDDDEFILLLAILIAIISKIFN